MQLTGERLSHFTTARANYITPHHTWESVCPCNGTSTCRSAVWGSDGRFLSSGRVALTIHLTAALNKNSSAHLLRQLHSYVFVPT